MSILPPLLLTQIRTCAKQLPPPVLEAVIKLLVTHRKPTPTATIEVA